jgi:site-specific DNA-methyltransferase (adenine-specific)
MARKPLAERTVAGNVLQWGTGGLNLDGCRIGEQRRFPANLIAGAGLLGDEARFFYCPKASRAERNAGCEGLPFKDAFNDDNAFHAKPGRARTPQAAIGGARDRIERGEPPVIPRPNNHPTVKAVDLMRHLVRMITPPGGVVLDPFAGSGSTGVAALQEGFAFQGIELSADYCRIAEARLKVAAPAAR